MTSSITVGKDQGALVPEEAIGEIIRHCPPSDYVQLSKITSFFPILRNESFWKIQCKKRGYRNCIKSSTLPTAIEKEPSWRARFADNWQTERNWHQGNHQTYSSGIQGQVCLLLNGSRAWALSAYFPSTTSAPLKFWDLESGKDLVCPQSLPTGVTVAAMNDWVIFYGDGEGKIWGRDVREAGQLDIKWLCNNAHDEMFTLSTKASLLVAGSRNGVVNIWDWRSGTNLKRDALGGSIVSSAVSRGGSVALGTLNGQVAEYKGGSYINEQLPSVPNCMVYGGENWIAGLDDGNIMCKNGLLQQNSLSFSSPITCMHKRENCLIVGHSNGAISYQKHPANFIFGRDQETSVHSPDLRLIPSETPLQVLSRKGRSLIWQVSCDVSRIFSSSIDRRLDIHDFGPSKYYLRR